MSNGCTRNQLVRAGLLVLLVAQASCRARHWRAGDNEPSDDAGHEAGASGATGADHDASTSHTPADAGPTDRDASTAHASSDPTASSRSAVQATLEQNAACQAIAPFYWEIGDAHDVASSGSIGSGYTRDTVMEIASASKWLYSSYYVQKVGGELDDADELKFLTFTSGYASLTGYCLGRSVSSCNQYTHNTAPGTTDKPGDDPSAVDRFDYNSGHLEAHAERYGGLADKTAATLGAALSTELGDDIHLTYDNPLLAGGARTTSADYARFLQKLLRGELRMHDLLGSHAVCTLSADYATLFGESCDAVQSPWWPRTTGLLADTPDTTLVQNVHYSLGHWVETDGAFSSPGLFGFYPWIDADKRWYGIIARRQAFQVFDVDHPDTSAYAQSVQCGQAVRAAWLDGQIHM